MGSRKAKIHLTPAQHISPGLSLSSVHGEIGLSFLRPFFFLNSVKSRLFSQTEIAATC